MCCWIIRFFPCFLPFLVYLFIKKRPLRPCFSHFYKISPEYSEITPVVRTKDDGILTYLVSGLEYTNCTFVKYGPIIHAHLHGTCPYQLGVNIYAKITDPAFIPSVEITAVAAFASGTAKNGTGILKIKQDGSINIIATEEGLNWIFADVFYVVG